MFRHFTIVLTMPCRVVILSISLLLSQAGMVAAAPTTATVSTTNNMGVNYAFTTTRLTVNYKDAPPGPLPPMDIPGSVIFDLLLDNASAGQTFIATPETPNFSTFAGFLTAPYSGKGVICVNELGPLGGGGGTGFSPELFHDSEGNSVSLQGLTINSISLHVDNLVITPTSNWTNVRSGYTLAVNAVPEPSTFVLLGMGAVGLLAFAWRRRKRNGMQNAAVTVTILLSLVAGTATAGTQYSFVQEVDQYSVARTVFYDPDPFPFPGGSWLDFVQDEIRVDLGTIHGLAVGDTLHFDLTFRTPIELVPGGLDDASFGFYAWENGGNVYRRDNGTAQFAQTENFLSTAVQPAVYEYSSGGGGTIWTIFGAVSGTPPSLLPDPARAGHFGRMTMTYQVVSFNPSDRDFHVYFQARAMAHETTTAGPMLRPVPEPSTFVLLGMGAVGLLGFAWRRRRTTAAIAAMLILAASLTGVAQADVFNMGGTRNVDGTWNGLASLEMVTVGTPGNVGQLSGASLPGGYGPDRICGAVNYTYNIGKYEVTAGQYCEFLNKVAGVDTNGLYTTNMWSSTWGCKIERYEGSGTSGDPYKYRVATDYENRPVNWVSWGDVARFCNWLANGQPTGAQGLATTEDGSYDLNGATTSSALMAVMRKTGATWFIPSEDEWYKAAYHKNDGNTASYFAYPTSSDTAPGQNMGDPLPGNNANHYTAPYTYPIDSSKYTTPVGEFQNSASPYGTFDQGGNVHEWNEANVSGSRRGARGGSFYYDSSASLASSWRGGVDPLNGNISVGFRVASVPEPSTIVLLGMGAVGLLGLAWRRRKATR